jgi:hypothetical protein
MKAAQESIELLHNSAYHIDPRVLMKKQVYKKSLFQGRRRKYQVGVYGEHEAKWDGNTDLPVNENANKVNQK